MEPEVAEALNDELLAAEVPPLKPKPPSEIRNKV